MIESVKWVAHAAAKATEAAAPEATETATAAPRRIARTRTHGYAVTREADHKRKPNKSRR